MNVQRTIASIALAGLLALPTLGMGQGRPNPNRPNPKHSNDIKKDNDRRSHDRQDNDPRETERRVNERRENERRDNERRDRERREHERRENERRENERRYNQRYEDNRRNSDRWNDNRQDSKNEWRNIGLASGIIGLLGLLNKDSTLTFAGAAGALYSAHRYEQDRKSQNRLDNARSVFFGRTSFDRDGHRYERRTVTRGGQKYYQFVRSN